MCVGGGMKRLFRTYNLSSISGLVNMSANALAPSLIVVSYNNHFPPETLLSCQTSVTPSSLLFSILNFVFFLNFFFKFLSYLKLTELYFNIKDLFYRYFVKFLLFLSMFWYVLKCSGIFQNVPRS